MKMLSLLTDFQNCSSSLQAWIFVIEFIALGAGVALILMTIFDKDRGYKQGQIDALNGKVKYELKENEDKEMVWEEIKKEEEE